MKAKKGFTLVELLVVICIIVILAAMLLPALGSARRRARRVACIGNEHNIGLAYVLYTNDHSIYPQGGTDPGPPTSGECFYSLYMGYQMSAEAFSCPANSTQVITPDDSPSIYGAAGGDSPSGNKQLHQYGYWQDVNDEEGGIPLMADVTRAVLADARSDDPMDKDSRFMSNHTGGVNVLFVDTHVEWVPLEPDILGNLKIPNPHYQNRIVKTDADIYVDQDVWETGEVDPFGSDQNFDCDLDP